MSPDDSVVTEAKALIAAHEECFESGYLDAVMANFADDVAMLAADTPVVEGHDALRTFYQGLLEMGTWSFRHDYSGAAIVGDAVVLHGVSRGTHSPANGEPPTSFANNLLIVVKRIGGKLKAWRAAFMPGVA